MEQRRALLAVVISVLILFLYQEVIVKRFHPAPAPPGPEKAAESTGPPIKEEAPPVPDAVSAAPQVVQSAAAAGRDVVIDTELYRAVFTTAGARLRSLELKRYRSAVGANSPPLQLVMYPVEGRLPLGVALRGAQPLTDAGVVYEVDREQLEVANGDTQALTFVGRLGDVTIRKRIEIRGSEYLWKIAVDAHGVPTPSGYTEMAVAWDEGMDPAGAQTGEVLFDAVVALQGGKLRTEAFQNLETEKLLENDIEWVGFSGRYFLAALVPQGDAKNALRVWMKRSQRQVEAQLLLPPGIFSAQLELYVGPKVIERLEAAGHGLRRSVDLGWFTFVALPMLQVLRFLHRFTGNYGLCIIILTVGIKLLFYPLTKKSFESMRQMQKLQPEMAKIRERLKDKPDEMNREVMELYRRHKVNPLGGCLPMVLQLPVFVGLYNALMNAVELRHAPFVGWITDLSAPDRLGVFQLPFVQHPGLPVLTLVMGVSMFVQQWMTPSAADPAQQRMMMIMPVIFTFMFINFPAGLTLYWLVNNILTIAQQYAMTRPQRGDGRDR